MAGVIRERWFADAWEFTEGDIRDVEYRSGQLGTPAKRGSNAAVAGRTGQQWGPKVHDSGTFTLEVWFGTYQRQAQAMWDDILKAVDQPHRLTTWRRITASGEVRTCEGEVTAALQPTAIGQSAYRASIEVNVPRGYWRGETLFTATTSLDGAPALDEDGLYYRDVDLTQLAPSTAALEELTLGLTGELVRPRVLDLSDRGRGEQLIYEDTVPAAKGLTLGCADWSLTGTGGLVPDSERINYTGHRFLTVAAAPPGVVPRLRLAADTMGPGGQLSVSGYRSYLC